MTTPLGAPFVRHCLEPLRAAASKLEQGRPPDAFAALAPGKLREACQAGVRALAKQTGVPVETARQAVPNVELNQTIDAIGVALEQVRPSLGQIVGSVGSLLPGPPQAPRSAGEALAALAAKYSLDEHIRDPLQALSDHVTRWERLVVETGQGLNHNAALRGAVLRRLLVRVAVIAALAVLLCAGLALLGWQRIVVTGARDRIDLLIAHQDPCAAASASPGDVSHATPAQVEKLAHQAKDCASARAKAAYLEACRSLAVHLDEGKLAPDDAALAGESAALLRRVTKRTLTTADLQVGAGALPCQDTPAAGRLWDAYAESAATSPELWGEKAGRVSEHVVSVLRGRKGGALDEPSREALVSRTEVVTKRAVTSGLPAELDHARGLCGLVAALGYPTEPWCKALARIDKKEAAARP